jgi:cleavage stimulation factor subunit 2
MSVGKVVYVGSIPYDQTEEQILDIFRSVGPVANFKLVFDKDTGKSKGFGFVEYHDKETAASAVRNLNNFPIGSRNLRVDFSHEASLSGTKGEFGVSTR